MLERMGKPTDFETGIPDGILSPSPQKKYRNNTTNVGLTSLAPLRKIGGIR